MPAALDQSRHGIDQIKRIVLAMKDFSHPGDTKEHANINRGIESTVTVARNEWKYVADVELDLDEHLPAVPCIPSTINQAVLNIVVNAAHAIADVVEEGQKGKITIRTRATETDAVIEIEDTGGGIPDHIRERIFDPFFTTKEVGKGTGQGLAIAYSVIRERHAGSISVDSAPGRGTCFTITVPLVESTEEVAA
jgi:signal transduction histidine kinase